MANLWITCRTICVESEEVQPGIVLDYDKDERVVGVEILSLSTRVVPDMIEHFEYEAA